MVRLGRSTVEEGDIEGSCWRIRGNREERTGAALHPARAGWRDRSNESDASENDLSCQLSCPASAYTTALAEARTNGAAAATEDMSVEGVKGLQAKFEVG